MQKITVKLIGLAKEFSQKHTVSMYDLLQKIDQVSTVSQISENDLYKELIAHPNFTNDWLEYSEDKRCSGWYFKSNDADKYLVGYLDKNKDIEMLYEDKLKACAVYLKHELDTILQ